MIYFRSRIIPFIAPYLPTSLGARLSNYTPLASFSFADQASAGLTSSAFDLEESNIGSSSGESRVGLDATGVEEVRRIMAIERCNFDQARLIRHNRILAKNGIAPDGEYLCLAWDRRWPSGIDMLSASLQVPPWTARPLQGSHDSKRACLAFRSPSRNTSRSADLVQCMKLL